MSTWAIIVAAGTGRRFGGLKQYEPLAGRRVVDWSIAAARGVCDGVVLVVPPGRDGDREDDVDRVVPGGDTRSASVRAGLAAVPHGVELVLVHDAARPLASARLWAVVLDALAAGHDAVIPVVDVPDTLWRADGGGPVDRDAVVRVQTPQGFRVDVLRRAHATGADATDDASLVHAAGGGVVLVPGEHENVKITDATDLRHLAAAVR